MSAQTAEPEYSDGSRRNRSMQSLQLVLVEHKSFCWWRIRYAGVAWKRLTVREMLHVSQVVSLSAILTADQEN